MLETPTGHAWARAAGRARADKPAIVAPDVILAADAVLAAVRAMLAGTGTQEQAAEAMAALDGADLPNPWEEGRE